MKAKQSYAEYLKDWRHLLGLVATDPDLVGTAPERHAELAALVANVDQALQQQAVRNAEKQAASQQIRQMIVRGRELSRDMKMEVRGKLGARGVELVKLRLKPLGDNQQTRKTEREATARVATSSGPPAGVAPQVDPAANGALKPSPAWSRHRRASPAGPAGVVSSRSL